MQSKILWALIACLAASGVYGKSTHETQENRIDLKPALEQYLRDRGTLCLGKFDWPIDVSERDRQVGTNDAIQMPVLERLGLVTSSAVESTKRYRLTEAGKKYYLPKKVMSVGPGDKKIIHERDFCAAKLRLDKVVGSEIQSTAEGHKQTQVKYTYKIEAAEWTHDAQIRQVFPMIDRLIEGEGRMQLEQSFVLLNGKWSAVESLN